MEDKLRQWGSGLRTAWSWVFQPLLLGLLLIGVVVAQPLLHLVQSWLAAAADREVYQQMARSQGYRERIDSSVQKLVTLIPVERLASIGRDDTAPPDAAPDATGGSDSAAAVPGVAAAGLSDTEAAIAALSPEERALLLRLQGCRQQIADSLSLELQRLSERALAEVPAYITTDKPTAIELEIDMSSVREVLTECGGDVSRVSLEFLTTRFGNLATDAIARQLSDTEVQAGLADSATAAATLGQMADELDRQRGGWMAHARRVQKTLKAGGTAARWRGLTDPDATGEERDGTINYSLIFKDLLDLAKGDPDAAGDTDAAVPGLDLEAPPPTDPHADPDPPSVTAADPAAPADPDAPLTPWQIFDAGLTELEAVHQRFSDRLRALPPDAVAAADDPATYVRAALGEQLADESALLVETYSKPYLASVLDVADTDTVKLTELGLSLKAALMPVRQLYMSVTYNVKVAQHLIWLLLLIMAICAWQVRKAVAWLLAACLGIALLTGVANTFVIKIVSLVLQIFYPKALEWGFFRRLMDVAAASTAHWAYLWLVAAGLIAVFGLAMLVLRRRVDAWSLGRPLRPYLEHLVEPEHRSTLADPFLVLLGLYEYRASRRPDAATARSPEAASLRRRLLGAMAIQFPLLGLFLLAGALLLEPIIGGILFIIPFIDELVNPYIVGNLSNLFTGLFLYGLWLLVAAGRDALVLAYPRPWRWLDVYYWCGLQRQRLGERSTFQRWLRLLLVHIAVAALVGIGFLVAIGAALAGSIAGLNVLLVLSLYWIIDALRVVLRARVAPLGHQFAGLAYRRIEDDGTGAA